MPFVHENVKVELFPGTPSPIVYLSENDVGDTVVFELVYKGQPVNIPSGSVVKFKGTKKDGLGFTVDSSNVSGNVVSFVVSEDMTSCSGVVEAEISITLSNNKHGTCNVVLIVEKNPHSDGTQDGSYPQIVSEMRQLVEQIEGDAETASNAANTAVAAKNSALEIQQDVHQYTADSIDDWLDQHPEATTTVQDGSLTYKKLVTGTLGFVTPEMFGAVGDGVTDDSDAFIRAIGEGNKIVELEKKTYRIAQSISLQSNTSINGNGATLKIDASDSVLTCLNVLNCTNVNICNLKFASERTKNESGPPGYTHRSQYGSNVHGIGITNSSFINIRSCEFINTKSDFWLQNSGDVSYSNSEITIDGWTSDNSSMPIYGNKSDNVSIKDAYLKPAADMSAGDHHFYIGGYNHDWLIENATLIAPDDAYGPIIAAHGHTAEEHPYNIKISNSSFMTVNNSSVYIDADTNVEINGCTIKSSSNKVAFGGGGKYKLCNSYVETLGAIAYGASNVEMVKCECYCNNGFVNVIDISIIDSYIKLIDTLLTLSNSDVYSVDLKIIGTTIISDTGNYFIRTYYPFKSLMIINSNFVKNGTNDAILVMDDPSIADTSEYIIIGASILTTKNGNGRYFRSDSNGFIKSCAFGGNNLLT